MGMFGGRLRVEDGLDGVRDTLLEPLVFDTADGWTIVVPEGFTTDYASVPRWATWVVPREGRYNRAAVVHDWLYRHKPVDPSTGLPCTRGRADGVFREACAALGVGPLGVGMWGVLRLTGWWAWRKEPKR